MNTDDDKPKRTFIEFERSNDGSLKRIGKYKGSKPAQAARKAIMKKSRRTGETENIDVILHEPEHIKKNGKKELRFYTGFIKNEEVIDPKMAAHQRNLAIKKESWVLDESGNPKTVFDDGYDSSQDPVLKGRRPVYRAKRVVSSYIGKEDM